VARARRYLAGYRGLTRDAYTLDLRQFTGWCRSRSFPLFSVRRADIETFPRARSPRPGTRHRHPQAVHHCRFLQVRRRRGAPRSFTRRARPTAEAGLRVTRHSPGPQRGWALERGHRTLVITRKGGKVVTIPLAPRTARAIDLAIGERTGGPLFLAADGRRLDRHGAARIVRRVTRRAGIAKHVSPHTLRHAFITAALDAGVPLRDVQEAASHADPRTTMRYDRARTSLDRHGPTLWPPTSPERPGSLAAQIQQGSLTAISGQTAAAPLGQKEAPDIAAGRDREPPLWPKRSGTRFRSRRPLMPPTARPSRAV
jgi:integrase/recombinase XerD